MLLYNGETSLAFTALFGPTYSIQLDGCGMRYRTVLVRWKKEDTATLYALKADSGIQPLCKALCLDSNEGMALDIMLESGKNLFGNVEHRMTISSQELLCTRSLPLTVYDALFPSESMLAVLKTLGMTGRELLLTGLLQQLTALLPDDERPNLVINLVKGIQAKAQAFLGAINLSHMPGANGTAPLFRDLKQETLLLTHNQLMVFTAGHRGGQLIEALENQQILELNSNRPKSLFPAVPIIATDNLILNGAVWNVDLGQGLPQLSNDTLDLLREAAGTFFGNFHNAQVRIEYRLQQLRKSPSAYRTTLVRHWPGPRAGISVPPSTCANGKLQPHSKDMRIALKRLDEAYAIYYRPDAKRTKRVGPFLCYSEASLLRLLTDHDIPAELLGELLEQTADYCPHGSCHPGRDRAAQGAASLSGRPGVQAAGPAKEPLCGDGAAFRPAPRGEDLPGSPQAAHHPRGTTADVRGVHSRNWARRAGWENGEVLSHRITTEILDKTPAFG